MFCLLLVSALLAACTGKPSVHGPPETVQGPEKVLAFAGEDVILPCTFNITATRDFPTVEWSKKGLNPDVIFLYRDGCEVHEEKNAAFEYRTSFVVKNLKNGDISLRISDLQLSDTGTYQCKRMWMQVQHITTVELVVGAVSEPKLSVVSAVSGRVTLQCEASCWLLEPKVNFLDDQGNYLPAEEPRRDQNASGCYTVRRRVTLDAATSSVTCRVHQVESNQSRETQILIPAHCMRSCFLDTVLAAGGSILALIVCGLVVCLWKKCGKPAGAQKPAVARQGSDERTVSATKENQMLLEQRAGAGNLDASGMEQLTQQVANLNSQLQEKDKTIQQLQNKLVSQLSPVVCQQPTTISSPSGSSLEVSKSFIHRSETSISTNDSSSTPTVPTSSNPPQSANLPQSKRPKPGIQRQSSIIGPAHSIQKPGYNVLRSPSSSSASSSGKKLGHISRSMSESYPQPDPNPPRFQRRHSFGRQSSLSNNPFIVLRDLKEDSELLMS